MRRRARPVPVRCLPVPFERGRAAGLASVRRASGTAGACSSPRRPGAYDPPRAGRSACGSATAPSPKHFGAETGQCWIVLLQFRARVDVVVQRVVLAIVVEPVLHAFRPVLLAILAGIRAFPQACVDGLRDRPPRVGHRRSDRACAAQCRGWHARTRGSAGSPWSMDRPDNRAGSPRRN